MDSQLVDKVKFQYLRLNITFLIEKDGIIFHA